MIEILHDLLPKTVGIDIHACMCVTVAQVRCRPDICQGLQQVACKLSSCCKAFSLGGGGRLGLAQLEDVGSTNLCLSLRLPLSPSLPPSLSLSLSVSLSLSLSLSRSLLIQIYIDICMYVYTYRLKFSYIDIYIIHTHTSYDFIAAAGTERLCYPTLLEIANEWQAAAPNKHLGSLNGHQNENGESYQLLIP